MSAVSIAHFLAGLAPSVGGAASTASAVLPWIGLVGGLIPGFGSVVSGIQIAIPIAQKIAALAPAFEKAVSAGMPILEAMDKASPALLPHVKELYATLVNHDPTRPEAQMKASDVPDRVAVEFAGPAVLGRGWTAEETQRWYDKQGSAST